ncbi:MAG TPA: DegT/DnrJ/EryC1/StrS family aminotransferase [Methylomirabilota bacterium]|nr:DegT/DnrJ/EryC1/StrS family aminotransferase [Methylomirabilota bacterium]
MTTASGSDYIVQMQPWLGEEEKKAVVDYLDSGGWLTEFRRTREFEQALGAYIGARHVSVVMNGTVSLFAALAALGIGAGDEVIVPDLTMIASANAVLLTGATPRFVDIERATLCLDLAQAERAITPRTKAIMLVAFNGRAPDMDRAVALARDRGVFLVEDAAQALGSRWRGRHLGTFGAVGSFSFSSPKVITTGQGGALVTDDDAIIAAIRKIKDFGRLRDGVDEHIALGYNFKFTDLQAVIGLAQMTKLDWRVQRKKELFALYRDELADVSEVTFVETNLGETSPWFIDVLVPDPAVLRQRLHERGIGSRPFYPPIHTQAPYRLAESFPETERASRQGLWLPSSSFLEDRVVRRICDEIRAFYRTGGLVSA